MSNKKEVLTINKDSLNSRDSLIGFLVIVFLGSFAAFSNLQSKINDFENRLVEIEQVDKLDLNKYQPPLADNDAQFLLDKITSLENDVIFLEKSINEESKIPDTTKDDISNLFTELAVLKTSVNDLKNPKKKSGLYDPAIDDISYLFTELAKLKTSVKDLKNQKKKIENNSVVNDVSSSEKYKYKSNWRKLSIGMNRQRVRAILGEPDKINVSYFENWFYPKGSVTFSTSGSGLYNWSEPKWN